MAFSELSRVVRLLPVWGIARCLLPLLPADHPLKGMRWPDFLRTAPDLADWLGLWAWTVLGVGLCLLLATVKLWMSVP